MRNRKENEPGNEPNATPTREEPEHRLRVAGVREHHDGLVSGPAHPRGNIGKSLCIRGELTGNEDLTIEGKVEGKIDLMDHNLTIGPNGKIKAEVGAKKVIVEGEFTGNINAGEKVELSATGRVKGDIVAPRVVIADGAYFKGMVNMSEDKAASARPSVVSETMKPAKPAIGVPDHRK
jgi:cytoskeletal protein CcmA (bactofilin family)